MLRSIILGVFVGKVEHRWPEKAPSAIHKLLATGLQEIGELGFINDAQADLRVHGGADKAIHHYPADHYMAWRTEGEIPLSAVPASFGENISSWGTVETNICIGDICRLGTAIVQVSQGRQPCWKLNNHTGNPQMAFRFQETGRTGWYYRVLQAGKVEVGDEICLIDRFHEEWSVSRVTKARLTRRIDASDARTLSQMPELAENWREAFKRFTNRDRLVRPAPTSFRKSTNVKL